jgi:catalase
MDGGFTSYAERIDARKIRERSPSFFDHFSQATLFFNSQSEPEKNHIVDALRFELGKVETPAIRQRMLMVLNQVDKGLAAQVAYGLGMPVPETPELINLSIPADADPKTYQPVKKEGTLNASPALSMANTIKNSIRTRKVAFLAADGVDEKELQVVKNALLAEGAVVDIIAPRLGEIMGAGNTAIMADKSLLTVSSVLYDAVFVPGGIQSVATLEAEADAVQFLNQAFKHCKPIAASAGAMQILEATYFSKKLPEDNNDDTVMREGVIIGSDAKKLSAQFIAAIAQHRFWEREKPRKVPA